MATNYSAVSKTLEIIGRIFQIAASIFGFVAKHAPVSIQNPTNSTTVAVGYAKSVFVRHPDAILAIAIGIMFIAICVIYIMAKTMARTIGGSIILLSVVIMFVLIETSFAYTWVSYQMFNYYHYMTNMNMTMKQPS